MKKQMKKFYYLLLKKIIIYFLFLKEWTEDAEEVKKLSEEELKKRRIKEFKLRTQVIQRDLPLPSKLNELYKTFSAAHSDYSKVNFFKLK